MNGTTAVKVYPLNGERHGRGPWRSDSTEDRHGGERGSPTAATAPGRSGRVPDLLPRRELRGWEGRLCHTVWRFLALMEYRLPQLGKHRKTVLGARKSQTSEVRA